MVGEKDLLLQVRQRPFLAAFFVLSAFLVLSYWPWLQLRLLETIEPPNKERIKQISDPRAEYKLLLYNKDIPPVVFALRQKVRFLSHAVFGAAGFRLLFLHGRRYLGSENIDSLSWLFICLSVSLILTTHPTWSDILLANGNAGPLAQDFLILEVFLLSWLNVKTFFEKVLIQKIVISVILGSVFSINPSFGIGCSLVLVLDRHDNFFISRHFLCMICACLFGVLSLNHNSSDLFLAFDCKKTLNDTGSTLITWMYLLVGIRENPMLFLSPRIYHYVALVFFSCFVASGLILGKDITASEPGRMPKGILSASLIFLVFGCLVLQETVEKHNHIQSVQQNHMFYRGGIVCLFLLGLRCFSWLVERLIALKIFIPSRKERLVVLLLVPVFLTVSQTQHISYHLEEEDSAALWIRGHTEWMIGQERNALQFFSQGEQACTGKKQKLPFYLMQGKMLYLLKHFERSIGCFHSAFESNINSSRIAQQMCSPPLGTSGAEYSSLDVTDMYMHEINDGVFTEICAKAKANLRSSDDLISSSLDWVGEALLNVGLNKSALFCFNTPKHHQVGSNETFSESVKLSEQEQTGKTFLQLGHASLDIGLFEDALRWYNKAIKLDKSCSESFFHKARVLRLMHQTTQARRALRKSLKINSTNFEAMHEMSLSFFEENNSDDAMKWIEKAIETASASNFKKLGIALIKSDRCNLMLNQELYNQVINCCDEIFQEADIWYEVPQASYNHKGIALVHLKQEEDAKMIFEAGLTLSNMMKEEKPEEYDLYAHAHSYNNLGTVYLKQDKTIKAMEAFRLALQIDKDHAHARSSLNHLRSLEDPIPLI